MFEHLLGDTMMAYIDDMVVKSMLASDHLTHLTEAFDMLKKHKLRLNAEKCTFGVSSGNFLVTSSPDASHRIIVLIEYPFKSLLQKADLSNQISQWAVELAYYEIHFQPRTSIKAKVLANFIAELTLADSPVSAPAPAPAPSTKAVLQANPSTVWKLFHGDVWKMYVNSTSNSRGAGAEVVLLSPSSVLHESSLSINFPASNNEAEYEALISGLKTTEALGIKELVVYSDSQLVVNQLSEEYESRDDRMRTYLSSAVRLINNFKAIRVEHISREQNAHADALVGLASACSSLGHRSISFSSIDKPSFELEVLSQEVLSIELGPSWMDKIIGYLGDDALPTDKKDVHRLRNKAALFWLNLNGKLYKRSFTGPYLLVAYPHQVPGIIEELHARDSGCHSGGRPLTRLWPFSQWGMDIVDKLPVAPGEFKFFLTATDYFSKWVEVEHLVTIEETDVIRFVWRNIISRFGVPFAIITDNRQQFTMKKYQSLLDEYDIK
ncbi:uncharacterized protein LOC131306783 [Rhododendron vialii]|uniref:uncharacterized protein LOC131306783 n=1 Tax=Rhododendron vialii TaxID=182163 RepID=UPI00265FD964|nr:uncharacterized protein LOC131306783 [Rhododendron vialii]